MYLKEALVVPAVIFILSVVWMQLVKGKTSEESQKEQTKRDINFEQAYMVKIEHYSSEYNAEGYRTKCCSFSGCQA